MVNNNIRLFLENNKSLENVKGAWGSYGIQIKCSALNSTLKKEVLRVDRINEALDIVQENTGFFSTFRGMNKLSTALSISTEIDMEDSLKQLIKIHDKLKVKFSNSSYLPIAAQIIFKAKDRIDIDIAINKTRLAYDYMKNNHGFLTGAEDVPNAAIIATTVDNLEAKFKDIETSYEYFRSKKLASRNILQSLSHSVVLINEPIESGCSKVMDMSRVLANNGVAIKNYYVPILGILPFITNNYDEFAKKALQVSQLIKKEKGFGFTLGSDARNAIAVILTAIEYLDRLEGEDKENIIDTTNSIALTVAIAMETAMIAASAAVMAASSSAGN